MTAADKARELYDKLYKNCTITIAGAGNIWKPLVKQQALIAVDEVLASMDYDQSDYLQNTYWHPIDYWQQVKEEIEKI